jgi:hypothetical protein
MTNKTAMEQTQEVMTTHVLVMLNPKYVLAPELMTKIKEQEWIMKGRFDISKN